MDILRDRQLMAKVVVTGIVMFGWLALEGVNIQTTFDTISDLLGDEDIVLNMLLVSSVVALDIGCLMRMATKGIAGNRSLKEEFAIYAIWITIATMNAITTWWDVASRLGERAAKTPAGMNMEVVQYVVPLTIAIIVFGVRVGLSMTFGRALDAWIMDSKPHDVARSTKRPAATPLKAFSSINADPAEERVNGRRDERVPATLRRRST